MILARIGVVFLWLFWLCSSVMMWHNNDLMGNDIQWYNPLGWMLAGLYGLMFMAAPIVAIIVGILFILLATHSVLFVLTGKGIQIK